VDLSVITCGRGSRRPAGARAGRALGLTLALLASSAFADIFSPGELAKPHEAFEGLANCTLCHPAGKQLSQESCLNCHTELKPEIGKGRGFHGRIATADRNCEKCHHEHQGRDLKLTNWGTGGQKGFNHARTGWPLTGAHVPLECNKCHEKRRISQPPILAFVEKHPAQETFLGLPTPCVACHFDEHRDQVGQECQSCHTTKAWKPAPQFDHNKTDYPLTGKHRQVACEKCHVKVRDNDTPKSTFPAPVSETFLKYAPLEFKACTACHKDVHEGRFGPRCATCHSTDGWRVIRNPSEERAFHDKTRFPLKGEHLDVDCKACHGPFPGQPAKFKGLEHDDCADCHPDAHEGQLKSPGKPKGPDCEKCHSVDGFLPVRFTLAQHQKTRYPLEGAHQTVACSSCHPKAPTLVEKVPLVIRLDLKRKKRPELFSFAAIDFSGALDKCDSCHGDVHQGQLKDKPCAKCHQNASFTKLSFDHNTDSKYPLTGKHAQVGCDKCHAPEKKGGPVKYRGLDKTCAGCHPDVHVSQFVVQGKTDCERCHSTKAFKPVENFKHEPPFTDYLLEGKHATVACEACHKKVEVKAGAPPAQRFKPLPRECEACHSDFHNGAFKGFEP
jgi:hypothetical protein